MLIIVENNEIGLFEKVKKNITLEIKYLFQLIKTHFIKNGRRTDIRYVIT